jgi:hypothetical protein
MRSNLVDPSNTRRRVLVIGLCAPQKRSIVFDSQTHSSSIPVMTVVFDEPTSVAPAFCANSRSSALNVDAGTAFVVNVAFVVVVAPVGATMAALNDATAFCAMLAICSAVTDAVVVVVINVFVDSATTAAATVGSVVIVVVAVVAMLVVVVVAVVVALVVDDVDDVVDVVVDVTVFGNVIGSTHVNWNN